MPTDHPGTIVFVDAADGSERERPAAEVPSSIAWVPLDGTPVPVLRIVTTVQGEERILRSYGAGGRLLSSTRQRRQP